MPKTDRNGKPIKEELPGTIKRSPAKAQRTFAEAHDHAAEEYGDEERAHRVAYGALKHTHEKRGDHWEPKDHKGPSDPRSADPKAREDHGESFGGVDLFGSSKTELMKRARELDVPGRSKMSKEELARAIARKQD
jgi:cation transport regulator ChaB